MMRAPRLVSLLRLPSRTEGFAIPSLLKGNASRFTCDTRGLSYLWDDRTPHSYIRRGIGSHNLLIGGCSQLPVVNQIHRFNSQKVKEEQTTSTKSNTVKQEALSDTPKSQLQSESEADDAEFQKLSLYGKIKSMYRDYWYVLIPVHLASSCVFCCAFYYAASSGVDIVAIMESLHFSEKVVNSLKDSSAGYFALTYALYKIFTPVRYTVTLGGTTWAIRFLRRRGLIKPRPVKEAKENVQSIISAMKLPEKDRQKFLEDKGLPRIGKAVGQASNAMSNISKKPGKEK